MKFCILILLAAFAAPALSTSALARNLERDMNMKTRPIMKVVAMLEDMKAELAKEAEDDKAVYELLMCWCKTGVQDKTKAIEMGQAKIEQLAAAMGEAAGKIQELKTKRK